MAPSETGGFEMVLWWKILPNEGAVANNEELKRCFWYVVSVILTTCYGGDTKAR